MPDRPKHATLYDFRDLDLMHHLAAGNGNGITSVDLADALGFDTEDGGVQPVGIRLAWMRRYGMVAFDDKERSWRLSRAGARVVESQIRAPQFRAIEQLPDESMIEVMAMVTSRFQRGETMLGHMFRREFMYGTKRR